MWNVKRLSEAESKRPIVLLVAIADMPRPKREAYLARGWGRGEARRLGKAGRRHIGERGLKAEMATPTFMGTATSRENS